MIISVTQLNNLVKGILDSEPILSRLQVRGEISQSKISHGYCYFTIKDKYSSADCFCISNLDLPIGETVVIDCSPTYYTNYGKLSFFAKSVVSDNKKGDLFTAFLNLKSKLEGEGLFDTKNKRPINTFAQRIGVITSPSGAVIRDIINVIKRRSPHVDIVLYPVRVQGDKAVDELIQGISFFNERTDVDTVIIGRGGGSFEDLNCFNNEKLVRAVAGSLRPIISAVGHETDFTLCDFVADLRAPTPSAAAELATTDAASLSKRIKNLVYIAACITKNKFTLRRNAALLLMKKALFAENINLKRVYHKVEKTLSSASSLANAKLQEKQLALNAITRNMELYSVKLKSKAVLMVNGKLITSISQLQKGSLIEGRLDDGKFKGIITEIEENDQNNRN